ncbi:MAG: class I SAM-dependent methyltransferase [Bdellovibrio sp.]
MNTYISEGLYQDGDLYDAFHMKFSHDFSFYNDFLSKSSNCLELGAGTGRLTIPLKKSGIEIEGLDLSIEMLKTAQRNAKNSGVHVTFHHADARNFVLDKIFDTIIFPANGFLHINTYEDLFGFFTSVKKHLKPDGLLVLDLFNPDFRFLNIEPNKEVPIAKINYHGQDLTVLEKSLFDKSTQLNHISWTYQNSFGQTLFIKNFTQRIFFHQEMHLIFNHFGFEVVEQFGDFDKSPYCSASRNQIFVVRHRVI